METLKQQGYWQLNKCYETKYFKNGKANLHVSASYCIEFDNAAAFGANEDHEHVSTGIFWIKTKREALKAWREFLKTRSIGGAQLADELFTA